MSYLDLSKVEDERVEWRVDEENSDHPLANRQRGMKHT